jgi:hypothetical protein
MSSRTNRNPQATKKRRLTGEPRDLQLIQTSWGRRGDEVPTEMSRDGRRGRSVRDGRTGRRTMRSRGADGRLCGMTCCCCCRRTSRDGGGCDVRAGCRRGRGGDGRRGQQTGGRWPRRWCRRPRRAAMKMAGGGGGGGRIHEGEGLLLPSRKRIDDDSTMAGVKWSGGCCCYCDDSTKKTEMGLGIEGDAAPRSKMKLPGAAQRRRRVADGFKKPGALIPC